MQDRTDFFIIKLVHVAHKNDVDDNDDDENNNNNNKRKNMPALEANTFLRPSRSKPWAQ